MFPEHPRVLDLIMPKAATLAGRVTDTQGNSVAGASARFDSVLPRTPNRMLSGMTFANGKFTVTDLKPLKASDLVRRLGPSTREVSIARFRVDHPDFATASVRYERVPGKVDVVLQPAAAITGTVLYDDSNRPAANIPVMLQCVHDRDQNFDNDPTDWAETVTDEHGRYRLGALRAGKYNVWATAPDKTAVALDSFEVKTGEKREAPELKLIDGGFLAGRLVDDATGETVRIDDDDYVSVGVYGPSRPRSGAAIDGGRVNP